MRKYVFLAFLTSLVAMSGSLYFSEVMHFIPCKLCWYQRILMYPLAALFLVGFIRKSKDIYFYTLPLSLFGMGMSLYHYGLQKSWWNEVTSCVIGVPCSGQYINWLGFITIPFLAFTAFTIINVLSVLMIMKNKKENN